MDIYVNVERYLSPDSGFYCADEVYCHRITKFMDFKIRKFG